MTERFLAGEIVDKILLAKYFHGFITRRNFKNGGAVKIITKEKVMFSGMDFWR